MSRTTRGSLFVGITTGSWELTPLIPFFRYRIVIWCPGKRGGCVEGRRGGKGGGAKVAGS